MSQEGRKDAMTLGLGAPRGFAPADLTSAYRAAQVEALVDAEIDGRVTELRIHGVSGSTGPTMLEHPYTLQVAGDTTAGFLRRWTPAGHGGASVPWRLEAYSWGGLTEAKLKSASWILLAPFMLYNVAHFMLPRAGDHPRRHYVAKAALRLLALGATMQITLAMVGAVLDTVALQAGSDPRLLPTGLGWLASWSPGARGSAALAAVLLGIALLWIISVRTASSYEARTPQSAGAEAPTAGGPDCALAGPQFWRGKELVDRQRTLHTVAALATVAWVAAQAGPKGWVHAVLFWVATLLLAATVVVTATPAVDRDTVAAQARQAARTNRATWLIAERPRRIVGIAVAAALVVVVGIVNAADGTWRTAVTGVLTAAWTYLGIVQIVLLCALWFVVFGLARQARAHAPYLRGNTASAVTTLAVVVGGLLSAVVDIGVARLCGNPVPSDARSADATPAVAVPAPVYAFAAASIGFGVAALVVGFWLWRRFAGNRAKHLEDVAAEYGATRAQDGAASKNRGRIASAWAVGDLADDAGPVVAALAVGGVVASAAAAFAPHVLGPPAEVFVQGLLTAGSLVALLIAGWLVATLRRAYSDGNQRRVIGAVWDVGTFWPRATHPFAPPCYAERAVPEVIDRIGVLAGIDAVDLGVPADPALPPALSLHTGPVLLTGYSQGSIIATAVIAQLTADVRGCVALLTLACPARRLYGRAFPAYFGPDEVKSLVTLLSDDADGPRWTNLARRSDYIGSWVEAPPTADPTRAVDRRCLDPVALVPDTNPTRPPVHRHSAWWPDPRVAEVATELVGRLTARPLPAPVPAAGAAQCRAAHPHDVPAALLPESP